MSRRDTSISVRRAEPPAGATGFTLIEVMVAMTIVAFAFVGLLGLHNRNLKMIGDDQNLTQATLLARRFITEMEVVEQWPDTGTARGEFPEMPGFYWEREVEDTDLTTVRRVVLHVFWDERNPNAVELVYFIRDRREPET
jgi:general secretion pathway protein I